jgi:homoserine dehydrogenase
VTATTSGGRAPLRVGLVGAGTVGAEVARLLRDNAEGLAARIGAPVTLAGVAVRDLGRAREGIDPALLTDDAEALVSRGDLDIVVEVMGGIEPARSLILSAMEHGASVVTANKALLAEDGATLFAAAEKHGVDLYYRPRSPARSAAAAAARNLAGDNVRRVLGIVNGTTNFILTKMDEQGADYDEVLAEAQALGYAEADPTADVEGYDAAAKAAILASLAFHSRVSLDDVHREGISDVSAADVAAARDMGFVVKLLAVAELAPDEQGITVRVHPAMVPRTHPLASVREAFNAVFVEADAAGQVMFYGRGAGGAPTASAVLGDVVAAARNKVAGSRGPGESSYAALEVRPVSEALTRYYVHLQVADRPGVLATIAQTFADHGVSIQVVRQDGAGDDASLLVRTHDAGDGDLSATLEQLRGMDAVRRVVGSMRVEGEAGS